MKQSKTFSYYVSDFFTKYLPGEKNLSTNTIYSYRDTFVTMLRFYDEQLKISADKIKFQDITAKTMEQYFNYLESELHCSIATRNQRMAAIKSFFRYMQVEEPAHLSLCQEILAMPSKKKEKPSIEYLSGEEIQCLLAQPDTNSRKGRRDLAILALLYDSAARVQELCDVKITDLRLESPPTVHLYGKGRKGREIPLSSDCAKILEKYIKENHLDNDKYHEQPLFFNSRNEKLTRSGVGYILNKYMEGVPFHSKTGKCQKITPHCIRHSKAMHLLESGVNLIYIRDFLGHEYIETTEIYAKANPEAKRKAIQIANAESHTDELPNWKDNDELMNKLRNL